MDPLSGWAEIRPYNADTWKFLRAAFKCCFFLLSATVEESSLERILGNRILVIKNILAEPVPTNKSILADPANNNYIIEFNQKLLKIINDQIF